MTNPRQHCRRPTGFRISMDLTSVLAETYPLDAEQRAQLTEPVALLVELGETVTRGDVRQLARDLRGRRQLQTVVTRRARGGRQLVKVMTADALRAHAADCDQTGRLMHLERTLRTAA